MSYASGRFVTAMGAMVRPMLTMILSQKLGMNAVQVAWITALMGILTIPANLIGGKMADRFNKKNEYRLPGYDFRHFLYHLPG